MTDQQEEIYTLVVDAGKAGNRLDRFLADGLADLSRSQVKALITQGQVSLRGADALTQPSARVQTGQEIQVTIPPVEPADLVAEDIPLDILYEDDHLLVLVKPASLVVHPAPGNPDGTLVNALLAHCGDQLTGIGGVGRPGIVHRLDKGTSGVMVVAKTQKAHAGLVDQFSRHDIERAYKAVVRGIPKDPEGTIDQPIGRHPQNRKKMAVTERNSRRAVTHYRVEKVLAGGRAALVDCRLETGRTHQIRVHMAHLGHPLLGDPLYGRKLTWTETRREPDSSQRKKEAPSPLETLNHQALHAYFLGFRHTETGQTLSFEREIPADLRDLIRFLETY